MKKKLNKAEVTDAKHRAPVETALFAELMPLVEHCCITKYDDGESRETGWVTIKVIGAGWMVQVKDPDSAMSFSATGATLDQALETAALLLGCDDAPWEPDPWLAQKKRPKGKK